MVVPPGVSNNGTWELPPEVRAVKFEIHDPTNRPKLSYLATTKQGRRIYLNRTAVDADQLVVVTCRGYDPVSGYAGAEQALFPTLSDDTTQEELAERLTLAAPGKQPNLVQREAGEVAWLLGAPFFLQLVEGSGDELAGVVGGLAETSTEGQRMLNARWRVHVDRRADTVVAGVAGDPKRHEFAHLARALACAARVVKPDGRIILLTQAHPELTAGMEVLRKAEDPQRALDLLRGEKPADIATPFLWASAASQASVYLLSGLPNELVEELLATPLENLGQVRRLLNANGSYLSLEDAHKTLAELSDTKPSRDS